MIYRFAAVGYRIDPLAARRKTAVLQRSTTGGMTSTDWQDIGAGFTDLQITRRYWMRVQEGNLDNEGTGEFDWFSGSTEPTDGELVEIGLSLVVRSTADLNAVPTKATPELQVTGYENHNRLGDSPSYDLASTPDGSRPVHYRGNHIYRWLSVRVDLRNLGVGRSP